MKLTLIEPHAHFGVLKKWVQVCVRTKWDIEVISSPDNWSKIQQVIPEATQLCSFIDLNGIRSIPPSDLIIFLSLQLQWKKWNRLLKDIKYGILVHNGNMYFQARSNMVKREQTHLPFFKYHLKKLYENIVNIPSRNETLKHAAFVIPFSNLELPFFNEFSPVPVKDIILQFKPPLGLPKENQVLLYLYNRIPVLNTSFLEEKLRDYRENRIKVILISTIIEYADMQPLIPDDLDIQFAGYPLEPKDYYHLLKTSRFVCLPFQKDWIFNIYHEELGITKYSGRIRDALEYGCEIHIPEEIPLEDADQIPTLEKAAERMEETLDQLVSCL